MRTLSCTEQHSTTAGTLRASDCVLAALAGTMTVGLFGVCEGTSEPVHLLFQGGAAASAVLLGLWLSRELETPHT